MFLENIYKTAGIVLKDIHLEIFWKHSHLGFAAWQKNGSLGSRFSNCIAPNQTERFFLRLANPSRPRPASIIA